MVASRVLSGSWYILLGGLTGSFVAVVNIIANDLLVIVTILGMGIVTYVTQASGIWAIERIEVSDRIKTALEVISGAVLISLITLTIAHGGLPEWGAVFAVLFVAVGTGNIVLAMITGIGVLYLLRNVSDVLV